MQSDRHCDNYTNSELRLKSEIEKNDKCISKLILADYRIATSAISYSAQMYNRLSVAALARVEETALLCYANGDFRQYISGQLERRTIG